MDSADPFEQLAFKGELRSYFGLTQAQVDEMQVNWNTYYQNNANIVVTLPPLALEYQNSAGIAYWQWCVSYFTRDDYPPEDSVAFVVNTVTGYPEMYYWKNSYFLPNINN